MASQNTIFDIQNKLVDARHSVIEAIDCVSIERDLSSAVMTPGTVYPENKPAWLEVYGSAVLLKTVLTELINVLADELEEK